MSDLLTQTIEAHGGGERFAAAGEIALTVRAGGWAYASKLAGLRERRIQARVATDRQRTAFLDWPEAGQVGVMEAGRVWIESGGERIAERSDPVAARRSARRALRWGPLEELYFNGYALWQYLAAPFAFAWPDFAVSELAPWEENGERWRRLAVRFPRDVPAHSREEVFHIDSNGLIRRLDYTAEVFGRFARACHYWYEHREFEGLVIARRRAVRPRLPGNRPFWPLRLVDIEIEPTGVSGRAP